MSVRESRIRPALSHLSALRSQPDYGSQQQPAARGRAGEHREGNDAGSGRSGDGQTREESDPRLKSDLLLQRYESDFSERESFGRAVGQVVRIEAEGYPSGQPPKDVLPLLVAELEV